MSKTSLTKINLKDKINDGEIDLSLCELQEVPVKEIAAVRKIHSLDLSTNLLVKLPHNFSTLTHLTKLDLSKNKLRTLPENFGNLTKLRYLDLYKNEIEFLPLSFYKLKSLRWLDLKDNPLAQSIKDIAGPCVDAQDCQRCAHEIVKFFTEFDDRLNAERKKREEHRQQSKMAREQAEQKVKKQEKKKKKKEKQMRNLELYEPIDLLSYEEVNDGYGYDGEVNSYKSYKDVERKKKSFFANIVKTGFKMVLVIAFVFVVSTAKHDVAVRFSNNVANMYNVAVQNLPFNAQYYFVAFGENVFKCHKATAQILSNFIDNVGKAIANRHVSFDYLVYYKNQLYEKIDYFYTKYVS